MNLINRVPLAALLLALSVTAANWRFDHEGKTKRVWSVGPAGVWMIDDKGTIYYNEGTSFSLDFFSDSADSWNRVSKDEPAMVQLDVGTDIVWGVNENKEIFYRAGISQQQPEGSAWRRIKAGRLTHVTVSPRGCVWAIDERAKIYHLTGASTCKPTGTSWEKIHGRFVQVSAGKAGVWAVNANGQVYHRIGTFGDVCSNGSKWQLMNDKVMLKYISSGEYVFGVGKDTRYIYERTGISQTNQTGTGWRQLSGQCDTLDTYSQTLFTSLITSAPSRVTSP